MTMHDEPSLDPKNAAILQAAFEMFARYGLRRTSMADIAKAAGMSRPALYLHYSGKEDIFNALVHLHFKRSEKAVAKVLGEPRSASETLLAAFHAIDGDAVEAMLNSPHADEMLSLGSAFSQEAVQEAHRRITGLIATWIATGVADGRLSLSDLGVTPEDVARLVMATKFGIKTFAKDFADYRALEAQVADVFGKALAQVP